MSRRRFSHHVLFLFSALAGFVFTVPARSQTPDLRLETRVIGQNSWLTKSTASVRVIVLDHSNSSAPVPGAKVEIRLTQALNATGKPKGDLGPQGNLFSGQTTTDGTLDASFAVPNFNAGNYGLEVQVNALGETDVVDQALSLTRSANVLITTDKPLYQPGQIIHIRALALQQPSLTPLAASPATIEVSDGKGNKVFKKIGTTSAFGVASADFQLADEINLGTYRVRAETPLGAVEKTVTVGRYVLPKFKVTTTTDRKFYSPGQVLTGDVQADYFFGKPVGGKVKVILSRFDVGFNDFATVDGTLNSSGHFRFSQPLPTFFAGTPLEQGNAFVKIDTTVTDTADHPEEIVTTAPVAQNALRITAIPESGDLVPGVQNTLYLVANYPDGSPATANIVVRVNGGVGIIASTDNSGIGYVQFTPGSADLSSLNLQITASDTSGNTGTWQGQFYNQYGTDSLLLHTEKALYNVGETAHLTVLSPSGTGTIYFDVIRGGQTILTDAADLVNGKTTLDLPLDNSTAGTLEVHAYRMNQYGQMIRDTRILFVNPASDLKIAVGGNGDKFLPGSTAKLSFKVTNGQGAGVAAALGVNIVDESVFALQAMQPGMEAVYFLLEQEILDPKYEIHGIDPGTVIAPPTSDGGTGQALSENQRQAAAQALFANVPPTGDSNAFDVDTYTKKLQQIHDDGIISMLQDGGRIAQAMEAYKKKNARYPTLSEGLNALVRNGFLAQIPVDRWGKAYVITANGDSFNTGFTMRSFGPDKKDNTGDELYAYWNPGSPITSEGRTLILPGDANGDGVVQIGDAVLILQAAVNLVQANPQYASNYDTNADGKVDIADAVLALQYAVNLKAPTASLTASPWGDGGIGIPRGGDGGPFPPPILAPGVADGAAGTTTGTSGTGGTSTGGTTTGTVSKDDNSGAADVRVRQFFPETLYSNPSVITDDSGQAEVDVPIADSITTWRISALASSMNGQLGSTDAPLLVFQDFFVDIDFPVQLTQGDEVTVPVAVYNYLPNPQTVTLTADPGDGFDLIDDAAKTVTVGPDEVVGVPYKVKAKGLGFQAFTVHAQGQQMADAIKRSVMIIPNGARAENSESGRLTTSLDQTIHLPDGGIDGSYGLLVKVYPGLMSQVVDGMDSIFQMPYGCFEQTTSTTYPNVLALSYLKKTGKSDPAVQLKAEGYINLGYQRLLTFEVPGGGFEWFGHSPANQVLTAYGLLEFADMSKVYSVDPALLQRTGDWLAGKQNADGTWSPDKEYLQDGVWNNLTQTELPVTAYAVWALAESGYTTGGALINGVTALNRLWPASDNTYMLALTANALVAAGSEFSDAVLQKLLDQRKTTDDGLVYWESTMPTISYSQGGTADVETTAYITYALVRSGKYGDIASKALSWLAKQKSPDGNWGNTQATVMALKALIASVDAATRAGSRHLTVTVNGQEAGQYDITPDNADVLWQLDAKPFVKPGDNDVKIDVQGDGQSMYQITGWGYVPWEKVPDGGLPTPSDNVPGGVIPSGKLDLTVTYDRTELDTNGSVTAKVHVGWDGPGAAKMVIVDLGLPPGFDMNTEEFDNLVKNGVLQKYSTTGRQIICYLDKVDGSAPVEFTYTLKAKYPITAQTPQSDAYAYYNPEVRTTVKPQQIIVK